MNHKLSRVLFTVFAMVMMVALFAFSGSSASAASSAVGNVYTSTNSSAGNAILTFARAADGTLTPAGSVSTGGLGTGAGLGSQGALALSENGHRLFAVNAGSHTISFFDVTSKGLVLRDQVPSGGASPISLTVHKNILYVLNAGSPANITGFEIEDGTLNPIAGSTRSLSAAAPGPAQVAFSPNGRVLVVTEKATNKIDTYSVNDDGIASGPQVFASSGTTPFGFAFDIRGHAIVSEAATGALSSYAVPSNGALSVISPSVLAVGQHAACWVVTTKNGRFAYTTNAASGTISGYATAPNGALTLLDANGITASTGGKPLDLAISVNDQFLYVFNDALHAINIFKVNANGSLTDLGNVPGLAVGGAGLVAR